MVDWEIYYTKQAQKDAKKIARSGLKKNVEKLIDILKKDPFSSPPKYEKLVGDLAGIFSRRINIQHRLVYEINESDHYVKILRMWSHYGEN